MTTAVCTAAHGAHRALLDVTGPALERYARRFGAQLVVLEQRLAPERPPAWDKVLLLQELAAGHDHVVWVDADAAVLDSAPDITGELATGQFLGLVEHTLPDARVPNTGVMVLRGGATARRFLRAVWASEALVHHRWWENAAVLELLGYRLAPTVRPSRPTRWRLRTRLLDRAWNSIPADPAPEPHVVHFPGLPLAERLTRLRAWAG